MKKIIIVWIGLILFGFSVVAQENTENIETKMKCKKEKKERVLLHEKGDWAIGADMLPLLRTLGTVFWGANNITGFQGTPYFSGMPYPTVSIMSKYMVTNKLAVRANMGITIESITDANNVRDDVAFFENNSSVAIVTDYVQKNTSGLSIALGSEYRYGKKRVVGVFGADLLLGYYGATVKYTYGNIMTEVNQKPTIFQDAYYQTPTSKYTRTLLNKNNGAFSIGAQLTAGMEVFVAPKIALGGQVNLSYVFTYNRQTHRESEGYNVLSGVVEQRTDIQTPARWSSKFSTNNLGGALYIVFYF